MIRLTETILFIGREILKKPIPEDVSISIRFDDSIIEDRTAEQKRDMELVSMGLMLDWEFRKKYYGETEEQAKAKCKETSDE